MAGRDKKERKGASVVGQAAQLAKLRKQIIVAAAICVFVLIEMTVSRLR